MTDTVHVTKYPFILPTEGNQYCTFPAALEADGHIFFHGTLDATRPQILAQGFVPRLPLVTVSYSRTSGLALEYACRHRSLDSPDGCIFAVRFDEPNRPGIEHQNFGVHVYNIQPAIIGYCIIPGNYVHR